MCLAGGIRPACENDSNGNFEENSSGNTAMHLTFHLAISWSTSLCVSIELGSAFLLATLRAVVGLSLLPRCVKNPKSDSGLRKQKDQQAKKEKWSDELPPWIFVALS